MMRLVIKGGYGEHGRSCFITGFDDLRVMFDCGILDTDQYPYPTISKEEAQSIDLLFLSHAHKDHTGAVDHLIDQGFKGQILASKETLSFAKIDYDNTLILNGEPYQKGDLLITYGPSGHCPGSLWAYLRYHDATFFYSGDMQIDPLLYEIRLPKIKAKLAIIDMAHDAELRSAKELRADLVDLIAEHLAKGQKIILPVQLYGRGNELLYLIASSFKGHKIAVDRRMKEAMILMMQDLSWLKEDKKDHFLAIYDMVKDNDLLNANIIFTADTHLESKEIQDLVASMIDDRALVIATGRKKQGSYLASLLDEEKAIHIPYLHHQSRSDAKKFFEMNEFDVALPFHGKRKEVWHR